MVLDHVGRKQHAVASLGGEFAEHEIFSEIIFKAFESADSCKHAAAGSNSRTDGKMHAFEHARSQRAAPKIRVHSSGFQLGPKTFSGNGAIGASCHSHFSILKFSGHGAEHICRHANIAVAHNHKVVRCRS